jgi:hypothetical protein
MTATLAGTEPATRGTLRNALALIVGIVVGGAANMAIVTVGPMLIPPPPGADVTTPEGLRAAMPLLEPRHFLAPLLAHAGGTFVGALVGALLAVSRRSLIAYSIGTVFLLGGIAASFMIPAPVWFIALDLLVAYVPMAWLGLAVANRMKPGVGL